MTTFYIIRHGQSGGNLDRRFWGQFDGPLTELGKKQAQMTADYLKDVHFDAAVASEKLCLPFDTPELETIGSGDTLTLCCGDSRETFGVASAVRGPALSEEEDMKIFTLSCSADLSKMEQADALFNAAPWKLEITLSRNPISEAS